MKDETVTLLENNVVHCLKNFSEFALGTEERRDSLYETEQLLNKLLEVDKLKIEAIDKEQRRKIDEDRNYTQLLIEEKKGDINWKRSLLEAGKILVPLITCIITMRKYEKFQANVMEYEKTGFIKSTAGRHMGLPRIVK